MKGLRINGCEVLAVECACRHYLRDYTEHEAHGLPEGELREIYLVRKVLREILSLNLEIMRTYDPPSLMAVGLWDMVSEEDHRTLLGAALNMGTVARYFWGIRLNQRQEK